MHIGFYPLEKHPDLISLDKAAMPEQCENNKNCGTEETYKLSLASSVFSAATAGLVCAALPEAIGDTLFLAKMCDQKAADRIKYLTHAGLIFATGSYLSTATSYATTVILNYVVWLEIKIAQRVAQQTTVHPEVLAYFKR